MAGKRTVSLEIRAEDNVSKTLARISGDVSKLGSSFTSLARIAVPAIGAIAGGAALKSFAETLRASGDAVDSLGETAQKLNLPVAELQKYQIAAKFAGVESGTLERGLGLLNKNVGNLRAGLQDLDGKTGNVLKSLGLTDAEILGDDLGVLFEKIVAGLSNVEDPAKRSAQAIALFGKSAQDLNILFEQGSAGLERAAKLIRDYGIGLDDLDAAKVGEMNDKFDELALVLDIAKKKLVVELSPAIRDITRELLELAKAGRGIGPAIADGVKIGAEAIRTIRAAGNLLGAGNSLDTNTAIDDGGGTVLLERIEFLEELQARIRDLQDKSGVRNVADDLQESIAILGSLNLSPFATMDEAFAKAANEIATLKEQFTGLPQEIKMTADATQQLAKIQEQLRDGVITQEQAASATEAVQNGLKSQNEELEFQKKLQDEILAREQERQKLAALATAEQEKRNKLTEDYANTPGVLPPRPDGGDGPLYGPFLYLDEKALPPLKQVSDAIAGPSDSVAASIDTAGERMNIFAQAVVDDAERVKDAAADMFNLFEEYGKSVTSNVEDAIDDFVRNGEFSMKEFARSIIADLAAITAKAAILGGILGNTQYGGNGSGLVTAGISSFFQGSYAGGGYTGDGPRSGGLDGMGGFAAVLHPGETVIDHKRNGGKGAGGDTYNITNNNRFTEATPAGQMRALMEVSISRYVDKLHRGGNRAKHLRGSKS